LEEEKKFVELKLKIEFKKLISDNEFLFTNYLDKIRFFIIQFT